MTEQRWAIIANPVAGRGQARALAPELERSLGEAGVAASLDWTGGRGDGEILAQRAIKGGATRLVACGGDGTVHELVNALMGAQGTAPNLALGIIPVGRCNDLATALGCSLLQGSPAEALLAATPRYIDVGCAGGRYFTTVAALGFDSTVAEYVDQGRPPRFLQGTAAYVYGVLVQLLSYRDVAVTIRDDQGKFQGTLFMVAMGNTTTYGKRLKITPSAEMDDGLLDVCLVPSVSRWEVLRILPRVFSGSHVIHPSVFMRRTRRMEIESEQPIWVWADGEPMTQTPTTIEVLHQALPMLAP